MWTKQKAALRAELERNISQMALRERTLLRELESEREIMMEREVALKVKCVNGSGDGVMAGIVVAYVLYWVWRGVWAAFF